MRELYRKPVKFNRLIDSNIGIQIYVLPIQRYANLFSKCGKMDIFYFYWLC